MKRILGLTKQAFLFGAGFTVVELITLVAWLILAGVPFHVSTKSVEAVIVLAVGLFIEHILSLRAGRFNTF